MATHYPIKIVVAQCNPIVGDIEANEEKALKAIIEAKKKRADLLVFPELFLMGYPPYDLLFEKDCMVRIEKAIQNIAKETDSVDVIIGSPFGSPDSRGRVFNAALHLAHGKCEGFYCKQCLPFYDVFFEPRYFRKGRQPYLFVIKGVRVQVVICEDVWSEFGDCADLYDATPLLPRQEVDLLLVLSASPWCKGKEIIRAKGMGTIAQNLQLSLLAVNQVGGQDDLLFDGRSSMFDTTGSCCWQAPSWKEGLYCVNEPSSSTPDHGYLEPIVFGISEYVRKTKAHDVVVGISGGIDSAVVASLAVRALGAEHVHLFFLPSCFTPQESYSDAALVASCLGLPLGTISIDPLFQETLKVVNLFCDGSKGNIMAENIQARLRCLLLMAQANFPGRLLLCTSNKSELSVGYATLYGDLSGALAPIGDLFKEDVCQLGRLLGLPEKICSKEASPELSLGQKTDEELPFPCKVLDPLLKKLLLRHEGKPSLLRAYVLSKEFKRRQAPVILKLSEKAFGSGRLFPIAGSCLPF